MAFTRAYLLLTHTADSVKLAFEVLQRDYAGDITTYFEELSRNLDGTLLIVTGASKREFIGDIVLNAAASGTVVYDTVTYTIGTPAQLRTALATTDLKAKAFDDTAFWNAKRACSWNPRVEYDSSGELRLMMTRLIEK